MPSTMFSPGKVSVGSGGSGPYLQSEAVRSEGKGPFDPAYRQNLAVYGGGTFQRPGGLLSFNPTDPNSLGNASQPTGGGNSPVPGLPFSLLDFGLGGQGFSYNQPQQAQPQTDTSNISGDNSWQGWLQKFQDQGSLLRGY